MADYGKATGFHRAPDGSVTHLEAPSFAQIKELLAHGEGLLWLDLLIASEQDAGILSEVFNFHPLAIEDCVSPRADPAKIDDHGDYIFVVVQALEAYAPNEELEQVEVDFFLGANYVVSCHQEPVPAIEHFRERVRRGENVLSHTADWVLHGLLDTLVDEYLPVVDAVDETIDRLEEQVLRRADPQLLPGIIMVKRNTLRLRRATAPQREIMNRLSRGEFPALIHAQNAIYFRDIYDHLTRVESLIEAVRDLADGALNTYLSAVSNRLNEVVRILTLVGTFFLPGTLIAGLYGMNFPAGAVWPPYSSGWGFWAVVGAIITITVGLLAYLRHRRWL
jgi:magnesium transporter